MSSIESSINQGGSEDCVSPFPARTDRALNSYPPVLALDECRLALPDVAMNVSAASSRCEVSLVLRFELRPVSGEYVYRPSGARDAFRRRPCGRGRLDCNRDIDVG